MKARMIPQPLLNIGMRMRPVVVQDQMKIQSTGYFVVYLTQKLKKLLVTMSRITTADYRSFQTLYMFSSFSSRMEMMNFLYKP